MKHNAFLELRTKIRNELAAHPETSGGEILSMENELDTGDLIVTGQYKCGDEIEQIDHRITITRKVDSVGAAEPRAWSVEVQLDVQDVTADQGGELHDQLDVYSPAVGTAPNGNLSVRIFVFTPTVASASGSAIGIVTEAAQSVGIAADAVSVEVITEEELDRRLEA